MSEVVYKGFGKEELERQFDPRTAVPDHQRWAEEREAASRDNRGRLKSWLNVPYGNSPRQVIDIFPSEKPDAPVLVHIHGGVPVSLNADFGNRRPAECPVPVARWHPRHWQYPDPTGSTANSYWIAPQAHDPA